jgi:transglutaminase-like putative cysteine protease
MKFTIIYRLSLYLMLTLAVLSYSVDATGDESIAMLYPAASAFAGIVAALTVDRSPRLALSARAGDRLGMGSIALALVEYSINPNLLLLSLAHWLFYLQIIKIFQEKSIQNDWMLMGLSTAQLLVGVVGSQSDAVGLIMSAWAATSIWVLGLFQLDREAIRRAADPAASHVAPAFQPRTCYEQLITFRFFLAGAGIVLTTLATGGLFFWILPRRSGEPNQATTHAAATHLTGFDQTIRLGQMSEILESERIVMTVELLDEGDRPVTEIVEPYWRGITMTRYDGGSWKRHDPKASRGDFGDEQLELFEEATDGSVESLGSDRSFPSYIRQVITLEPTDNDTLFALRPIVDYAAKSHSQAIMMNGLDGTLFREGPFNTRYVYEVKSKRNNSNRQEDERYPSRSELAEMRTLNSALKDELAEIAKAIVSSIPPDHIEERARAIERYLRDSGRYFYSLKSTGGDRRIDPNLDFLINRREGHCAYFASSLALLLRSIGIHTRLVNGFKGGDWDEIGRVLYVRGKHAHSWVEALVGRGENREPIWITLDPTPASQRARTVANVGGMSEFFRPAADFLRTLWSFYIVTFDSDRQNRLIYQPLLNLWREASSGFLAIWEVLKNVSKGRFQAKDLSAFFSFRGFIVSFVVLLVLVLATTAIARLVGRLIRAVRGEEIDQSTLAKGAQFYRRMMMLLNRIGLEKPDCETPLEFARRARRSLANAGDDDEIAQIPEEIVDAYYDNRFGRRELDDAELEGLEASLSRLEAKLIETAR